MTMYDSILDTIGSTPIVKLHRIAPKHVTLYAKVEAFNPGGSVKDRLALAIVLDAERKGLLKPGQTIVEATSGNTGIALAMVAAARGYPFVAVMTETFSIERRKLMRAFGAKVILTPAAERGSGMVRKAKELADKHGWFLARQFENEANPAYHRSTTGPEILRDFAGKRLDYFVSGWGTGGTITGAGEVLKLARPDTEGHRQRTGRRGAAVGQGMAAAQDPGLDAGLPAGRAQPHHRRRNPAGRRSAGTRHRAPAGRGGRRVRRHLRRGHRRRRAAGRRSVRRKARCCWRCCPTPASATCPRSCSKASARAPTTNGWPRWRRRLKRPEIPHPATPTSRAPA